MKGPVEEGIAIVFCFISMIIGMVAQYFYGQGEMGYTSFKFKLVPFLMPILASPIIFAPLLVLLKENMTAGAFKISKLMVYFVASQNGFFWKDMLSRERKKLSKPPEEHNTVETYAVSQKE